MLRARLRLLPRVTGRLDVNSDRQSFALQHVAFAGRSAFGPITVTGTRFAGDTMPPAVNVGRIKRSAAPASFGCQFCCGSAGSVFPVAIQTAAPRPEGVGRVSPESLAKPCCSSHRRGGRSGWRSGQGKTATTAHPVRLTAERRLSTAVPRVLNTTRPTTSASDVKTQPSEPTRRQLAQPATRSTRRRTNTEPELCRFRHCRASDQIETHRNAHSRRTLDPESSACRTVGPACDSEPCPDRLSHRDPRRSHCRLPQ